MRPYPADSIRDTDLDHFMWQLQLCGHPKQKLERAIWKNKSNTECGIIRPTNAIYMRSHSLLRSKALSKCEVNPTSGFQTAVAAILVFVECPKSIASQVLVVIRPYQNVKSIRQAVFKISCSQAISCIGYNVNLQIAVAAILVFVECPKSIASQVLVVIRPYQNVKSIRQAVFKISCSQAISCIGYNVNLQIAVAAILVFVECPKSIASQVLVVLRPY